MIISIPVLLSKGEEQENLDGASMYVEKSRSSIMFNVQIEDIVFWYGDEESTALSLSNGIGIKSSISLKDFEKKLFEMVSKIVDISAPEEDYVNHKIINIYNYFILNDNTLEGDSSKDSNDDESAL